MEYALKKAAYLKEYKKKFIAEPNWKTFWETNNIKYSGIFSESNELKIADEYIMNFPPKKQIINEDLNLDFENTDENLCVYIRRVRNNLFHGGKFSISGDTTRDKTLLENSIIILNSFVNLDKDVKYYYNEETYSLQNEDNDS